MTPADLLARELRRDPGRPFLTWYDDATGDRVELSVATAANWAAKLANLLVDEYDVEPGVEVGLLLPTHWVTAVLLLGTWTTGGAACVGAPGAVTFAADDAQPADVVLPLDPMGVGVSRIAAAQPDAYVAAVPLDPDAPALRVGERAWTHDELGADAVAAAAHHHVDSASRVLSTLGYDTADGLDAGLLVPLAAGAPVVLVTNADATTLADRQSAERVTHTFG